MIDDNTDRTDLPVRSSLDSSLSDTAVGSGIAQLEPTEEEEIMDLDPINEEDGDDEDILDLGEAEESDILDLGAVEEELAAADAEAENDSDDEAEQEVLDVDEDKAASDDAETAVSEPKTKSRAPDDNNEIFSTGDGGSSAADNLAMLAGGSASPETEDLSVFGDKEDKKADSGDIAKLSDKSKPLSKEMKLRRKNLKLQQSKQSTHTLRKTGIPLLITMGVLLLIVGVWTINIGQSYDPTRPGGNALKDNWVLFASASILLGVLLIGAAAFLQYEMVKFNKAADKFSRKLKEETDEDEKGDGKNGKKNGTKGK